MDLIVYKGTPPPQRGSEARIMSFDELARIYGGRRILRHLWKYRTAELHTTSLPSLARPFLTALTLRWLTRGSVVFRDESGARQTVSWARVVRLGMRYRRDRRAAAKVAAKEAARAASLSQTSGSRVWRHGPPVYLRPDLPTGVRSGGSVGHLAGVINNLDRFGPSPVVVASDVIPTVRDGIETHVFAPPVRFADIPEIRAAVNSENVAETAIEALGDRTPGFIYQRYGLNNYAGLILSRHFGVPLVLELNSSEVWKARHWRHGLEFEDLAVAVEMADLEGADLVTVVSRALRDVVVSLGIAEDRVLVNPNGVNADLYSWQFDGGPVRQRFGLEGKTVIGFIGTFGPWHGAEVLADAFGLLLESRPELKDSTRLLFIGDGERMPIVRERLAAHGVTEQTVLAGAVPQAEGPSHLAACDIFVSPHVPNADGSPFFNSPTKIFEYMAMRKPIVASALGQPGEILEHERTALLVEPEHPDLLADAIGRLIDDVDLSEALATAALDDVLANYTWEQHTRHILDALGKRCPRVGDG